MKAKVQDDLARHGRHSRVIWHPGSTPPYSSLWITIQRFLMLNQPTRAAFAQDFLMGAVNGRKVPPAYSPTKQSLNAYAVASAQSPVRLTRFVRVLREPAQTFRCCHIGQFSSLVRPYFGDFAVCPLCLEEGFHSVLYSFAGLRTCPVHAIALQNLSQRGTVTSDLFINALRNPFGRCQYLQELMGFASARVPKAHPQRDLALADIAHWLMDVGSRCWLGPPDARQSAPFDEFTQRICQLRGTLKLPQDIPNWVDADARLAFDSARMEIATLGCVKVYCNDLVDVHDRRAMGHQSDLTIYRHTLLGDFKAIGRHLKRSALGQRGPYWLARLANTASAADVAAIFSQGGAQARRAWLFLAWSRHLCSREFNPKTGLHTLPMRLAVSENIPVWVASLKLGGPSQAAHDFVRLWIARWICAAGLLAFWRSLSGDAANEIASDITALDKTLARLRRETRWSLGIGVRHELVLCIDHLGEPLTRLTQ